MHHTKTLELVYTIVFRYTTLGTFMTKLGTFILREGIMISVFTELLKVGKGLEDTFKDGPIIFKIIGLFLYKKKDT